MIKSLMIISALVVPFSAFSASYCIHVCNKTEKTIHTHIKSSKGLPKTVLEHFGSKKKHVAIATNTCKMKKYKPVRLISFGVPRINLCVDGIGCINSKLMIPLAPGSYPSGGVTHYAADNSLEIEKICPSGGYYYGLKVTAQ